MIIAEDIYQLAIDTFGEEAQIICTIEELSELTTALTRFLRGRENNVEEEIADCLNMLEQLCLVFDAETIKHIQRKKQERLLKRIEKTEKEF